MENHHSLETACGLFQQFTPIGFCYYIEERAVPIWNVTSDTREGDQDDDEQEEKLKKEV